MYIQCTFNIYSMSIQCLFNVYIHSIYIECNSICRYSIFIASCFAILILEYQNETFLCIQYIQYIFNRHSIDIQYVDIKYIHRWKCNRDGWGDCPTSEGGEHFSRNNFDNGNYSVFNKSLIITNVKLSMI